MSINQLIFRNLKKNIKNYYLYVFALVFSAALYFAFVTLQYDPSMDAAKGSVKGAAAFKAASVLLVAIVGIFLLFANKIFIKRRSKEIGLFQLIGMTKNQILRILSVENFILYFSSLFIGTFVGFAVSKFFLMILFKVTGVEGISKLHFSSEALIQTLIVFSAIYVLILLTNYIFIKSQSILSLFKAVSKTEGRMKKISISEVLIGVLGITLIVSGYYVSQQLFSGDFLTMNELLGAMIFILGAVIIGTYLFYKGSVRFVANIIRKKKGGYLNIKEVLSLSSIMFRMKSNALLLTIITTVSALAIGLLSLSYISYYSAEKMAESTVPNHFTFANVQEAETFTKALTEKDITYSQKNIDVIQIEANITNIFEDDAFLDNVDSENAILPIVSEKDVDGTNLSDGEVLFTGTSDIIQKVMPMKDSGKIELLGSTLKYEQYLIGLEKKSILSWQFTYGGIPTAIVKDSVFEALKKDLDPSISQELSTYIGIDVTNKKQLEQANDVFIQLGLHENRLSDSQLVSIMNQKSTMGLAMFIVGFLGLAFLIASGCILYFKQMDECEDEKDSYTILRKLGYTQSDLLQGIKIKQLFNFGIPLIIGLSHSYFAVQSGWFFFGTEIWTPMLIVMTVYTCFYSIFGVLSVLYYKKVIREAL
ncbi:bacitracin ABC transporter permease [Lysinibacillus contaminans]|uniref:Bacitracin ABC transporter permease n=1 Tax=Lysinibacillus contaminans TaxID=1293441 RepID=A0ABR5JXN2_9BACI|nr:ABC transporter permease [Lysinibacillus contaminans]KOS66994.1 bacitracin ABC transporter permease [Lysinibacillus contaminans]